MQADTDSAGPSGRLRRALLSQDGDDWIVAKGLDLPTLRDTRVTIEAGFRTDLGSVPRILWPVIGPHELSVEACLLHDVLCKLRGGTSGDGTHARLFGETWTSREAHRQFLADMLAYDVPTWRALIAYTFVRIFGPRWS